MNKAIIKKISLINFRKHEKLDFFPNKGRNLIIGKNASGKTSILEAIYLVSLTKSYKASDTEMIKEGKEFLNVNISMESKNYSVIISKDGKSVMLNKIPLKKMSEFIGDLNIVMFSPEDLFIIGSSPLERRRFVDIEISKYDKAYIRALNNYKKILRERNELLKQATIKLDKFYLQALSEALVIEGKIINDRRIDFCQKINEELEKITEKRKIKEVYQIKIKKNYTESWEEVLRVKESHDILLKSSSYGPHRDDIIFFINGQDAKNYASIGQQKTCLVSVKIALIEFFAKAKREKPILLLDDIFSELDEERKIMILEDTKDIQTFITATKESLFEAEFLNSATIINLT